MVEVRCEIALPAAGRRIKGHAAHRLLTEVLPGVVERALRYENLDARALQAHVTSHLDAQHLREQLPQHRLKRINQTQNTDRPIVGIGVRNRVDGRSTDEYSSRSWGWRSR